MLSLFVVNCRYIGYFSKCLKWWKVVRGCHARYQDFMVFGNQLKPAYYGIYYLHHLKAPRKGKKRSSYCSKFNEVKQWVKSGILMDGVVTIWNIGCLRERAVNVPYYILLSDTVSTRCYGLLWVRVLISS